MKARRVEVARDAAHGDDRDDTQVGGWRREAWIGEPVRALDVPGQYVAYWKPGRECVAFRLGKTRTRIGRSSGAQIRLNDPTVSRRHGVIEHHSDGFHILDDCSTNGVFVNGERVVSSLLHDGDVIVIGGQSLRFLDVRPIARASIARAVSVPN